VPGDLVQAQSPVEGLGSLVDGMDVQGEVRALLAGVLQEAADEPAVDAASLVVGVELAGNRPAAITRPERFCPPSCDRARPPD
jgi:hypothetical protein